MSFALSSCSPMAIPETRSSTSPSITCRAPGDYSPWAGRLSGRASPPRSRPSPRRSALLGVGLKVRPARLLRHPEHVLGQIQLVGVLAGCGILGGPLNVHRSNYVRHVGLVLE